MPNIIRSKNISPNVNTAAQALWEKRHREAEYYGMKEHEHNNLLSGKDKMNLEKSHKEMKQVILHQDKENLKKFAWAKDQYRKKFGSQALKQKMREYYNPIPERL